MSKGKRICFVSRNSLAGVPYYDLLLPCLVRAGWSVTTFAPGAENSVLQKTLPFACVARNIPGEPRLKHEMGVFKALVQARWGAFDVAYICGQFLAARASIAFRGPLFGRRLVYHNADYFDPMTFPLHCRLERALGRKSDLYINDEYHRAYITRTYYGLTCPVLVAPPNLPAQWPVPEPSPQRRAELCGGGARDAFVLMNCGGYTELRMMPQLIQALALLPPRYKLAFTLKQHRQSEVDAVLRQLGLESRVFRLPKLDFNEMLAYLVNADAGLILLANNDLGNFFGAEGRLSQYLACGLPVIASDHTGLQSLVRTYELGQCVNAEDPRSLAAGIQALDAAIQTGRYSRPQVREVFLQRFAFDHWEPRVVQAFENLFLRPRKRILTPPVFPWMPNP